MLAEPDRVTRALTNDIINGILVKLILEALSIQDARQYLLPLNSSLNIECAALVLWEDDLERVPVTFFVRWICTFLRRSIIQNIS